MEYVSVKLNFKLKNLSWAKRDRGKGERGRKVENRRKGGKESRRGNGERGRKRRRKEEMKRERKAEGRNRGRNGDLKRERIK